MVSDLRGHRFESRENSGGKLCDGQHRLFNQLGGGDANQSSVSVAFPRFIRGCLVKGEPQRGASVGALSEASGTVWLGPSVRTCHTNLTSNMVQSIGGIPLVQVSFAKPLLAQLGEALAHGVCQDQCWLCNLKLATNAIKLYQ